MRVAFLGNYKLVDWGDGTASLFEHDGARWVAV